MAEELVTSVQIGLWFERDKPQEIMGFNPVAIWNTANRRRFAAPLPTRSEIQATIQIISQNGWARVMFRTSSTTLLHRLMSSKKIYKVFLFAQQKIEYVSDSEDDFIFWSAENYNDLINGERSWSEVARTVITDATVKLLAHKFENGTLGYQLDFQGSAEHAYSVTPI